MLQSERDSDGAYSSLSDMKLAVIYKSSVFYKDYFRLPVGAIGVLCFEPVRVQYY